MGPNEQRKPVNNIQQAESMGGSSFAIPVEYPTRLQRDIDAFKQEAKRDPSVLERIMIELWGSYDGWLQQLGKDIDQMTGAEEDRRIEKLHQKNLERVQPKPFLTDESLEEERIRLNQPKTEMSDEDLKIINGVLNNG